jgi:outer membrane receptor protein involved in Fe transport
VDSQRIVAGNVTGIVDLGLMPQMLIQRVDVVTGGASASWGSDAVAGVVNVITDKKFSGFKASIAGSITTYGDDPQMLFQAAGGTDFAGGKGHIEASAEYAYEGGIPGLPGGIGTSAPSGRQWYAPKSLASYASPAATPAGMPQFYVIHNSQETQYGSPTALINAGPLQGITFDANGQPTNFAYGVGPTGLQCTPSKAANGALTNCVSTFASGGDLSGTFAQNWLAFGVNRQNEYARVSYDLMPGVNVWGTVMLGNVITKTSLNNFFMSTVNIACGNAAGGPNAFVPAAINALCVANKITSFPIGTANNNIPPQRLLFTVRDMRRYTIGANGAFNLLGMDWTWDSYYEHGETDTHLKSQNLNQPYYNAAIDSVVNSSGIVVCRSALAQSEGCQPYNPFVMASPNQAMLNWLFGGTHMTNVNGRLLGSSQLSRYKQDAFSVSANTQPFSTWAGPVSLATGFEYRREYYNVIGDACSISNCGDPLEIANTNWASSNFYNGTGKYHVAEGFVEFGVPLLKSDGFGAVDLDLGGRATGYSTSGYVNTWKVGLTWDTPIEGLRFRAVQSRDIRAPNLSELYAAPKSQMQNVKNDFTNVTSTIQLVTLGNANLAPEKAQNTELGVVYSPEWLPGFTQSVDYFRIYVNGQIASFNSQNISDLCFQGLQTFCAAITTNPPGGNVQTLPYASINATPFNYSWTLADGFDFETGYQTGLDFTDLPGNFSFRSLITHMSRYTTFTGVPGTIPDNLAGSNVGNGGNLGTGAGVTPHWKAFVSQKYATDQWSLTFTERFISAGKIDNNYVLCSFGSCPLSTTTHPTINENVMPSAFYLDLGGTYDIATGLQGYFKIDNLLNKDPPVSPGGTAEGWNVDSNLYDPYGRFYHVGIRINI